MDLQTALSRLSKLITKTDSDSETVERMTQALNFSKVEIGKAAPWIQLMVNYELNIIPKYTTGYATIVNGSRTVTLSNGGTVTNNFKGRYFKAHSTSREYEIINVDIDNNQIILRSKIVESSAVNC